jgi:hypothetical protein
MLYWSIFCLRTVKYCLYEASESALCLVRSRVLRYHLALKAADQSFLGSVPHIEAAQVVTITSVGGRHHSHSLLMCLTSTSSCFLVSSCFLSVAWLQEPLFLLYRLLRVLLLTLNFLATSDIEETSEGLKNAIASSIGAMVVEISRGEVLLLRRWWGVTVSRM